jgi:hypothetical protein
MVWFEIEHLNKLASLDSINEAHGSPMIDTCLNQGSSLVYDVISRQKQPSVFPQKLLTDGMITVSTGHDGKPSTRIPKDGVHRLSP